MVKYAIFQKVLHKLTLISLYWYAISNYNLQYSVYVIVIALCYMVFFIRTVPFGKIFLECTNVFIK
jgi:hypothetical protein